jgi:two-component system LytT family response regulator
MIRTVIVEDEPHARDKLRKLLGGEPDVEIVGECPDGKDASQVIGIERPDLVFLDIQIPGLNGMELVKSLGHSSVPLIVVTTAYADHAVWAFDIDAIDYLLKPYDEVRFKRAMQRSRQALQELATPAAGTSAHPDVSGAPALRNDDIVKLRVGTKIKFIALAKIRYITAQGDYVLVNTVDEQFAMRERIKNIEEKLAGGPFVRIHRSALLNTGFIKEMKPRLHGDYEFTMQDGAVFNSSASYRDLVQAMTGKA